MTDTLHVATNAAALDWTAQCAIVLLKWRMTQGQVSQFA